MAWVLSAKSFTFNCFPYKNILKKQKTCWSYREAWIMHTTYTQARIKIHIHILNTKQQQTHTYLTQHKQHKIPRNSNIHKYGEQFCHCHKSFSFSLYVLLRAGNWKAQVSKLLSLKGLLSFHPPSLSFPLYLTVALPFPPFTQTRIAHSFSVPLALKAEE